MSFILDALRKSEHDRQRQAGPGLAEVAVARSGSRTRYWATAAIALLLVNLLVIGMLLLRNAAEQPAAADGGTAAAAAAAAATAATAATGAAAGGTAVANPPADPDRRREVPPMLRPALEGTAAATTGARNSLEGELSEPPGAAVASITDSRDVTLPPATAVRPTAPQARQRGSVVYETEPLTGPDPAIDGSAAAMPAAAAPAAPETTALPAAEDLVARGGLPALHVDLHVYGATPAERFVFVNSRKYREGDTLQEGPRVEQITRDGAVLSYRGSRFVLGRQ